MLRLLALLALLATVMLSGCTSVFFQPMPGWVRTPDQVGLAYEDVELTAADGVRLSAWFLPARQPARGTVLFLHGNAENISTHLASVYWLPAQGYNVLLLDYRGYGQSRGTPTVAGAMADIDSAMRHLVARRDIAPDKIFVFGQSLGGALALHYVARCEWRPNIRGLIVDSSFSSYRAIAREKLQGFWLTWPLAWPMSLTVTGDHDTLEAAPAIAPIPLLLLHGEADIVIPLAHGQRLYAAAREPKTFWQLPGVGHIQSMASEPVQQRLVLWLDQQLK